VAHEKRPQRPLPYGCVLVCVSHLRPDPGVVLPPHERERHAELADENIDAMVLAERRAGGARDDARKDLCRVGVARRKGDGGNQVRVDA